MLVSPKIKEIFSEISNASVDYHNEKDSSRKYIKRLNKIFKENLTEEEQVFVIKSLLENLSYKNIIVDPENMISMHNVRLRSVTFIFFLSSVFVVFLSLIYKNSPFVNELIEFGFNVFKFLNI